MKTVEGVPGPSAWPGAAGPGAAGPSLREPSIDRHEDSLVTRFGPVPLDPDRQVRFRGGLPGFPRIERFQLEPLPGLESELMLLQAIEVPDIGFITLPLPVEDMCVLRSSDVADVTRMLDIDLGELMILAIVTLAQGAAGIETFLNLRAPLFVDVRRRMGTQVVLGDPSYPLRHRINAVAA